MCAVFKYSIKFPFQRAKFSKNVEAKRQILLEAHIVCSTLNSCASSISLKAFRRHISKPKEEYAKTITFTVITIYKVFQDFPPCL